MRPPVILLPPSEGKATGGHGPPWQAAGGAFAALGDERRRVRDAVRAVLAGGGDAPGRLLGARGPHLERALEGWRRLDEAPTLPAAARYSGVVWGALGPADLGRAARRRLEERVLVPSGLWGLVAAGDPLPDYRLRMGARVPPLGALAAFWRPRVSALVAGRAAGGWIIDLLPREHAAALDRAALGDRLLRVEIVEDGPDGRRLTGHGGKALKGRLARALLERDARDPAAIARLRVPGLRADRRASDLDGPAPTLVLRRA
ncbi:peroxide stress protein YaaA [Miltoncostaea marina]|uniref:peroxide stress protein YaaA n=1 Tax=Miltoncostaea marina TaxID=2843215 RepID=UPI001C3D0AD2|nr:peroxide stress protein YaaA [Miltoncostaea marina]